MTEIERLKICLNEAIKERDNAIWELEKAKCKIDGMNQYMNRFRSTDLYNDRDIWKSRAEAYKEESDVLFNELDELRHRFAKLLDEKKS